MDVVTDLENALPNDYDVIPTVHVEVCQTAFSNAKTATVKEKVLSVFGSNINHNNSKVATNVPISQFEDPYLQEHVQSVLISQTDNCETEFNNDEVDLNKVSMCVHVYRLCSDGPAQEELDEEDLAAANTWLLPSGDFHGLWESLVFDSSIKSQLLNYVSTTLLFSDKKVDSTVISWNRVVLLHGPPGTGKTSLCKALAQKLCIRMSDRYRYGQLVEINSHSLFSKWFSESGKLVMKMFQKIQELIDDQNALVCVLIDEVESLTAARKASLNGTEPSDALRVVNALLTQLDQIKKNPNVIILTTSNITGAIDLAFVDRADIKQYIGPPSPAAIYMIYTSCLQELMKAGIIRPKDSLVAFNPLMKNGTHFVGDTYQSSGKLRDLAIKSEGLSGRTVRKLPFIAHAVFLQKPVVTLKQYLIALEKAVEKQFIDQKQLADD